MKFATLSAGAELLANVCALDPDESEAARRKILVYDMCLEGRSGNNHLSARVALALSLLQGLRTLMVWGKIGIDYRGPG